MPVRLTGTSQMKDTLRRFASSSARVIAGAQIAETEIEATEAKRRTPVDTGALRGTVHAFGPVENGTTIVTGVTAGGPAAEYAVPVHEIMDAHHPVGQAKYVESVLMESKPYLLERIARRVRGKLGETIK